jgi:UDP:flavonoid glycosyltransferase YjiC (YdhE family)
VPFKPLLPYVKAYVTNGGFGGVQYALANGVPIVAAGATEDKPEVANRVAYSGVGINLRMNQPTSEQIRVAVRQVLTHERYQAAARISPGLT